MSAIPPMAGAKQTHLANASKIKRMTPISVVRLQAALLGKSAKDINGRSHKIGAWTYCSEPSQIDVKNFGAAVKLGETFIDSEPKGRIATWQGNGVGFVRKVLRQN